jgi:hypothetical protein
LNDTAALLNVAHSLGMDWYFRLSRFLEELAYDRLKVTVASEHSRELIPGRANPHDE